MGAMLQFRFQASSYLSLMLPHAKLRPDSIRLVASSQPPPDQRFMRSDPLHLAGKIPDRRDRADETTRRVGIVENGTPHRPVLEAVDANAVL